MERTFARSFDSLEGVFRLVGEFFVSEGIGERHRFAVDFALEEIFTNLVKYNPGNPHQILIHLEHHPGQLRIAVSDFDVPPFDPTKHPPPRIDLPLEERPVGGLGLFLTQKLMDGIEYEYVERRSTVRLTKNLE